MSLKRLAIPLFVLVVLLCSLNVSSYVTHTGTPSINYLENLLIPNWLSQNFPHETSSSTSEYNQLKTHPWLTLRAIQFFENYYPYYTLSNEIKAQIIIGSIEEDFDIYDTSTVNEYNHIALDAPLPVDWYDMYKLEAQPVGDPVNIHVHRAENHFMNGNNDVEGLTYGIRVDTVRNTSAMKWAIDDSRNTANYTNAVNQVLYGDAKKGWRYLGHVLHLVEDISVPSHVRNDIHIIDDSYEKYLSDQTHSQYHGIIGTNLGIPVEYADPKDFFNNLSTYTRSYYFSDDTIFKGFAGIHTEVSFPVASVDHEDSQYFYNTQGRKIAAKGTL